MPMLHITIKPPLNTAQPHWKPTTTGLSTKMIFLKANTDVKSSALLGDTKKKHQVYLHTQNSASRGGRAPLHWGRWGKNKQSTWNRCLKHLNLPIKALERRRWDGNCDKCRLEWGGEEVKPTQVRLSRVITFTAPSALQTASRLSVREISLPLV